MVDGAVELVGEENGRARTATSVPRPVMAGRRAALSTSAAAAAAASKETAAPSIHALSIASPQIVFVEWDRAVSINAT